MSQRHVYRSTASMLFKLVLGLSASCLLLTEGFASAQTNQEPVQAPPYLARDSCTWGPRPCKYPLWTIAVDAGVSHFAESGFGFDTGTGSITAWGPSWGLRLGAELTPWFAVDAHYIGLFNKADRSVSVGGRRGLLTNAAALELRFTAPTPFIQPYLFFGPGIYGTSVTGSSAQTALEGSTEFGIPIGVGLSVPLPRGFSVGAEFVYHRLFGESFAEDEEIGGGDPVSVNAVLRARL